jgi:hypothetical protein
MMGQCLDTEHLLSVFGEGDTMSVDLNVYLTRSKMPTPPKWAQAIAESGFQMEMDTDFDVDSFTGFLPCKFRGEETGFEYYSDPLTKEDQLDLGLPDSYDFSITFVTHADLRELAISVIASGVLCSIVQGVLCDPQSGESWSGKAVLSWIRAELAEIEKGL